MAALLAAICFFLILLHVTAIGPIALWPLGAFFLAVALIYPWAPWSGRFGTRAP